MMLIMSGELYATPPGLIKETVGNTFCPMSSITDFPARGRITAISDDKVTFQPTNTNYELSLAIPKDFGGKVGALVDGVIRVAALKVYTVPSGGNFVSPIFGPPRTIQGRVKFVDQKQLVIQ